MRAHTAQLNVDALGEAPCHRLPHAALNPPVVASGYTRAPSENVKTPPRPVSSLRQAARAGSS